MSAMLPRLLGLTVLLTLSALSAQAAGPAQVASYPRTLWPEAIDSPPAFDRASRQEILAMVRVISRTRLDDPASLQAFSRVKQPNAAGVERWLAQTRQRLLANYRAASGNCAAAELCPPPADWPALLQLANAQPASAAPAAWRQAAEDFHATYLYEQVRLAALFPRITSEVARLDPQELTGDELPDRQFVLSFDDGPSRNGETERLLRWLNDSGSHALFFALGENLERRLGQQSGQALGELYRDQCLASHGYRHAAHPTMADWRDSLERTAGLIGRIQPAGLAGGTWFRPPYGQRTLEQTAYLNARNGRVVLWNIDSQDWNAKVPAAAMRDRLITLMLLWRHGILLFHDIHPKALQALPELKRFMDHGGLTLRDCRQLATLSPAD